jgi:hypothetical protein
MLKGVSVFYAALELDQEVSLFYQSSESLVPDCVK